MFSYSDCIPRITEKLVRPFKRASMPILNKALEAGIIRGTSPDLVFSLLMGAVSATLLAPQISGESPVANMDFRERAAENLLLLVLKWDFRSPQMINKSVCPPYLKRHTTIIHTVICGSAELYKLLYHTDIGRIHGLSNWELTCPACVKINMIVWSSTDPTISDMWGANWIERTMVERTSE